MIKYHQSEKVNISNMNWTSIYIRKDQCFPFFKVHEIWKAWNGRAPLNILFSTNDQRIFFIGWTLYIILSLECNQVFWKFLKNKITLMKHLQFEIVISGPEWDFLTLYSIVSWTDAINMRAYQFENSIVFLINSSYNIICWFSILN